MRSSRSGTLVAELLAVASLTACTGGDDAGGSTTDFCADMRAFEVLQAEGETLLDDVNASAEQLSDVFARLSEAIGRLQSSAPDQIESDARLAGDTTQRLIDAYERSGFDSVRLATDPEYAEVLAGLDEIRVTEANDRLAVFVRDEC